ncbi:hypothetical protein IJI86_02640 [Candidatus Saccharibacteria bacterium]|nr:hypothetical protein [Candidatus Saccharibacteria bacterium]
MRLYKNIIIGIVSSLIIAAVSTFPVFASENFTTDVIVEPSLTVTIPSGPLNLNLDPSSTTSGSNNLTITVGTNNATGYKTIMTSQSGNTDLVETTDNTLTIPTLASGSYSSPSDFPANHWGYKKDSGSYIPFAINTTILESDTYANDDTTTLSFATKIDYLQASGTYKTTLVFTTTVNPLTPYIQNLDPTLCTTTPLTVLDKRDGEEYTVQRLADGNCWLLDNLRLDISDPAVQAKLNSTTTNATDTSLGYLKNGGGSSPYPANGVIAKTASSGSWADDYTNPYIATQYEDTTQPASGSSPAGKIGIYYNFCAASAGSYCYVANTSSGDATQDICPAGWRMPTGGASGEYQALYTAYSSNVANFQASLSTPLSGYFGSGSAILQGSVSFFWSSTFYDGYSMYDLRVSSSEIHPQFRDYRYYGFLVRCILNDSRTISDITNMQDITPGIVSRTADGATATLKDIRDGQEYTVAKINGNVWMTRNLAIGCNGSRSTYGSTITPKTLTNINSNISDPTWTTPTNSLTLGNDYADPRMECSSTYGAWYNYAAASAGTITGFTNTNAPNDICPAGWRLPVRAEFGTNSTFLTPFTTIDGGVWRGGVITLSNYGCWWSSTSAGVTSSYNMYWNGGSSSAIGADSDVRLNGIYVRCIAK